MTFWEVCGWWQAIQWSGASNRAGVAVTLVVHEHKRLGRGLDLAALAERCAPPASAWSSSPESYRAPTNPSGVVFTVLAALSGMERAYIRDRTLEGHESARSRGKATVTDDESNRVVR